MPRMSKKAKQEWAFFLNHRNRKTYNDYHRAGYQLMLIPKLRVGEIVLHRKAVGVYVKHVPREERESAA